MRPSRAVQQTTWQAAGKRSREARRTQLHFTFATQGNQGSRTRHREDHYTPEKFRMECVSKNLLRRYRRLLNSFPGFRFLELAKGFEPPTP
jgi:hypothetical protein